MPPDLDLRPYTASDRDATLAVFRRAIRGTASRDYTPVQIAAWSSDEIDPDGWAARRAAIRTQVAVLGGTLVGFIDVADDGYVDMLFVDPDAARRGVATALLGWVVTTARERGVARLTTHASLTARPFFEAQGFVVVAEQHPVVRGVPMTNFRMRRDLATGPGPAGTVP